ncbi:TPA: flavodoxin-dependent (E)-4-hydroxy-3-methylbut-2-enyl-diphosphate synthase [Candidatus Poribacteria bacterium]|nr:flavodoxin-dependent (E)-4-hydroxy-3-methylbut-2-enyl-diphosphate synthase [Candidatus Poribacteria bacterium]
MKRRNSRQIKVGSLLIGGGAPISVQSMTNTDTCDVSATISQIKRLQSAGCELVRVAVPNIKSASVIGEIKANISIPLVADIHFDYRLALKAIEQGIDKLRINPGNIGDKEKIKMVVESAMKNGVPIRIGVNSGSLEKDLLEKYGHATPEAMVESAMRHVKILEEFGFYDIVISLKASDPLRTIETYRLISDRVDYPLHLGVTEAGTVFAGSIRSAVGIGVLLSEGIGDTIRVSLTDDPVQEVRAGYEILKSLGLREHGVTIVSCPTCGRTQIDIIKIAREVEARLSDIEKPIKVAVMGCVVNGPGEAMDADIGIAGGKGLGLLFKKGEKVRTIPEEQLVNVLVDEVRKMI